MSKWDKSSRRIKHIDKKTVKKGKVVVPKVINLNTRCKSKLSLEKDLHEVIKREMREKSSSF